VVADRAHGAVFSVYIRDEGKFIHADFNFLHRTRGQLVQLGGLDAAHGWKPVADKIKITTFFPSSGPSVP
jgi:hypothetical protein